MRPFDAVCIRASVHEHVNNNKDFSFVLFSISTLDYIVNDSVTRRY